MERKKRIGITPMTAGLSVLVHNHDRDVRGFCKKHVSRSQSYSARAENQIIGEMFGHAAHAVAISYLALWRLAKAFPIALYETAYLQSSATIARKPINLARLPIILLIVSDARMEVARVTTMKSI